MIVRSSYAAVHLGDGIVSVLVDSDGGIAENEFETAVAVHAGTLVHLREDSAVHTDDARAERFPFEFVGDPTMLVGPSELSTASVIGGVVAAALARAGAPDTVDLLEIACPSAWGIEKLGVIHASVRARAREVLVVDTATAAAQSVGERAPASAIVVEVDRSSSTVSALSACDPSDQERRPYVRSGRWAAVGSRDENIEASVLERIAASGARDADVFLVDPSRNDTTFALFREMPRSVRRLRGLDVVRSMGARIGVSDSRTAPGEPEPSKRLLDRAEEPSTTPILAPRPTSSRAAAWLDDLYEEPPRQQRSRTAVIGAAAAAAATIVVVGVLVGIGILFGSSDDALSESRTPRPMAAPIDDVADGTDTLVPSAAPPPSEMGPPVSSPLVSSPPVSTPSRAAPSVVDVRRFSFGRLSVELPSSWSERVEPTRSVLVPPDFPDRRIVLSTTELVPGTPFDKVADDLEVQLAARGENSVFGEFTRATDFGGRTGISYVETPADGSVVRWYVFVEDGLQLSVGCQSASGAGDGLEEECARAVSTVRIAPL